MGATATAAHWQRVYKEKAPDEVSWFEAEPATSLRLIESAEIPREAAVVDVGGGASRLAAALVGRGYVNVTVADISASALARAREVAGAAADRIEFIEADVTDGLGQTYDLWHDRAVLHFMVDPASRQAYVDALNGSLRPGGHVVVATFGPEGPTTCSGLPVTRYGTADLAHLFGDAYELLREETVDHPTPSGKIQQFVYALFARRG